MTATAFSKPLGSAVACVPSVAGVLTVAGVLAVAGSALAALAGARG